MVSTLIAQPTQFQANNKLNMMNNYVTNVLDPVNAQDVATKNYADSTPHALIQTSTGFARVSASDSSGIVISGNNSGVLQQLLVIKPLSSSPTTAELQLNTPTFTIAG